MTRVPPVPSVSPVPPVSPQSVDGASGPAPGEPVAAPTTGWSASPDLGRPTAFALLRHGETALTPQKRFSGSGGSDPALSERGRWQAARAAEAFAAPGTFGGLGGTLEAVVSSPLLRCRETAGAVAERLGLPVEVEPALRETDFGIFEGLTFAEAKERHPVELDAWLASVDTPPPGGESLAEAGARVAAAQAALVERWAGRTVLLVSHVTPIKTFVRLALGAPAETLFRMELSAAAVCAVQHYRDGNASLRLFNDTSHLRG